MRLSVRLREGTRAEHEAAQGSGFLDALAAGRLPLEAYAELAAQHWFVYTRYLGQYLGQADRPRLRAVRRRPPIFVFPAIEAATFRAHYRTQLDDLPWSVPEQNTFLAEVAEAYRLNIAMLAELTERWSG